MTRVKGPVGDGEVATESRALSIMRIQASSASAQKKQNLKILQDILGLWATSTSAILQMPIVLTSANSTHTRIRDEGAKRGASPFGSASASASASATAFHIRIGYKGAEVSISNNISNNMSINISISNTHIRIRNEGAEGRGKVVDPEHILSCYRVEDHLQ